MQVYMYQAALYCEACGEAIRERLTAEGKAPSNPEDEHSFDSGDFPKGPYPEGGGEADCPQHCDACGLFLENALTADGLDYVREAILRTRAKREYRQQRDPSGHLNLIADRLAHVGEGSVALDVWEPFYRDALA
jgi:hypothetical protein